MKHADLIWDETGTPCSTQFDDVYFSKVGGLDETRHVFLQHNQLTERFQALSNLREPQTFVVAETGFGTGLNFLACCQLWDSYLSDSPHKLIFLSTEMYPLTPEDLNKALTVWPELDTWSSSLLKAYPKVCTGLQTLIISEGIQLMLAFGDAADSFSNLQGKVDAWFLDGFAPSKNPEMWSPALFQQIQRLSHSKTTFATFTAARVVKDLLTNHGFEFKKAKGFGRKRDMIHGWSKADDDFSRLSAVECANTQVWFQTPPLAINRPVYDLDSTEDLTPTHTKPKTATIIGAGLAGAHTARLLAERDWQVTVLEQGETVAFGASGNYQGVLYTKPSVQESKEDRFYLAAFQYAVQHYQWRFSGTDLWKQVGLVQIAQNEKDATKLARVNEKYQDTQFNTRISPEEANTLTGLTLNTEFDALHYPDSGWVNPAQACHNLLNHPNITVRCQSRCSELTERPEGWTVTVQHSDTGILSDLETDIVILCSAWESDRFTQTQHLLLTPIRGQVSQLNLNDTSIIAGAQTSIPTPKTVVCSDAYVTPTDQGKLNFGATFDLKDNGMDYRMEDVRKNRTKLASISEDFKALEKIEDDQFSGRASVRCITNDRLPILGMVNNHPAMLEQYQQLRKDRKWPYQTPGHYHKGLFANLGHGSKGLTTIPLCSAVLCAMIENDPLPLGQDLLDSLNPARFTISGLIKGKL